jgi:iron complex transport system substrate-binding protein
MSGIVTLLPAATEIVCALGLRDRLVGRSHECDWPPGVESLPALTRARIDSAASSDAIDTQVRELLTAGGPLYDVDEERLAALAPDVVVTQEACEVCAVSFDQVAACVARFGGDATIVSLGAQRLDDVLGDLCRVARACGIEREGERVEAELRARMRRASLAADSGPRPRVAVIEWLDPLMLAGHWVPDVVEAAGGVSVGVPAGVPSSYTSWDAIEALRPDVVVVAPCGFDLERAEREADQFADRLRAVAPRLLVLDGNAYLNRPGPRLVDAVEILAGFIQERSVADRAEPPGVASRRRAGAQSRRG